MTRSVTICNNTRSEFIRVLSLALARDGTEVRQVGAFSDLRYRELAGGSRWARWRLRLGMYGWYPLQVLARVWVARGGSVFVITSGTFFVAWLATWLAGRRVAVVYLLYDLFPDALIVAGTLREGSWVARRLAAITEGTFRRCAATVFIGERLRRHAIARYGEPRRGATIAVGADGALFAGAEPKQRTRGGGPTILYSGLLGRMHDTETLAGWLRGGLPEGVRVRFRASGVGFMRLCRELSGCVGVEWGGALPTEEWAAAMREAEVALVSVRAGAEAVVMPSKTYSALVAGQAVLAVCPLESDLADLVRAHDCGWVVAPGDVAGLRATVERMVAHPEEVFAKRRNAWRAGHAHYDQRVLARQWAELFARLERDRETQGDFRW